MAIPDKLRAEALALPVSERAGLAAELLASLDDRDREHLSQEAVEAAWNEEIERRSRAIDEGHEELLTMDEAWKIIRGESSSRP